MFLERRIGMSRLCEDDDDTRRLFRGAVLTDNFFVRDVASLSASSAGFRTVRCLTCALYVLGVKQRCERDGAVLGGARIGADESMWTGSAERNTRRKAVEEFSSQVAQIFGGANNFGVCRS